MREFSPRDLTDCTYALVDFLLDEFLQPRPCSTDPGAFRQMLEPPLVRDDDE